MKVESEKLNLPEIAVLMRLAGHSSRAVVMRESKGGFIAGEIFSGTDEAGTIVRVLPDGRSAMTPWATLTGETGLVRGLHADVSSGELIAVTTRGGVWRIDATGNARRIVVLITGQTGDGVESPVGFEDVTLGPNEPGRYGPWAGKVLAVVRDRSAVYAIDANGAVERFDLGIPRANNIRVIPAGENFFGVARETSGQSSLYGSPAPGFAEMAGDLLITQAGGEGCGCLPALWRVRWDGAEFQKTKLAELGDREVEWGQIAFSPYGAELLQQQGAIPLVGPTGRPAAVGAGDILLQEAFIPAAGGVTTVAANGNENRALRFINTLFNNGDAPGVFIISAPTIPAGFAVTASGDSGASFVSLNDGGSVRTNTPVNPRNEERNIDIRVTVPAGTAVDRDYDIIIQVTSATDATKFDRTTDRLHISAGPTTPPAQSPLRLTKTVRDLNGGLVLPGDTLEYSLTQTNVSNTPISRTFIAEFIPPNVTYIANSVQITAGANQGPKTDRGGDDQVEYFPTMTPVIPNGQINIFTGTGATATQTGTLAPNESNTVIFQVRVNAGLANALAITNGANCGANNQYPFPGCEGGVESMVSAPTPLVGPFSRPDAMGPSSNNDDFTLRRANLGSSNNLTTRSGQMQFINTLRNNGDVPGRFVISAPTIPQGFTVLASADSGATFVPLNQGTVTTPTEVQPFRTNPADSERNLDVRVVVPAGLMINTDYDVGILVCREDNPMICNRTIDRVRPDPVPPNLSLVKAVRSLTGADLHGQTVSRGTTVEYTLTLTNQSTSPAANAIIADYLPTNVTYVAGSSRIITGPNAGVKTDARGDDQVDYFPTAPPNPNGQINFFVGTGAAAFRGGTLAPNESTSVAFRVTINDSAPLGARINNGGTWGAEDFGIGGESNIVEVTVQGQTCVAPAITAQPVDRTICGGTSAFFNVTATGTNLNYQWRKDGVNIPGATSSQFVIVQVGQADVAKYDVVVSNACGTVTSSAAQLSIVPPPTITTQPVSQTRFEGQSVTFNVTAPGSGLTYQWRKNGVNIAGATGSSYTIASAAASDTGSYDCVVTGGCGSVTSALVVLTVNQCPAITVNPAMNQLPDAATGIAYSQTFSATGGVAPVTFSVIGTSPAGLSLNAMTGVLAGTPTGVGNFSFTVRATDANGCAGSRDYRLSVIQCIAPAITVQPADRTICGGTSAFFNVTATGTNLSYQWRKNGVNIPGATSSQFVIVQVGQTDVARYDVIVSNVCGMVTSSASQLSIVPPPAITAQPVSQTRSEGQSVTFTVAATGGLTYQWRKNGVNIPGATASSYTIAAVTQGDAGNYDCIVTGGCESVTSAFAVLTIPLMPGGDSCRLTICFRSANYFSLNWGTNNIPNGPVRVDGVNFGIPIASTDPRVKLALDGKFGAFNREYVAMQLNILNASGLGAAHVQTAVLSQLRCYGLDFDPVTVSGAPPFTRETRLFDLLLYLDTTVGQGISGRDACVLTRILNGLNGDSNRNVCHRSTAKLNFSSCN